MPDNWPRSFCRALGKALFAEWVLENSWQKENTQEKGGLASAVLTVLGKKRFAKCLIKSPRQSTTSPCHLPAVDGGMGDVKRLPSATAQHSAKPCQVTVTVGWLSWLHHLCQTFNMKLRKYIICQVFMRKARRKCRVFFLTLGKRYIFSSILPKLFSALLITYVGQYTISHKFQGFCDNKSN